MAELTKEDIFGGDSSISKLLEELETSFPAITPSPKDSIAEIMFRSGERSVVEFIKNKFEE
jgi:hypothetical protein|tara:strand:+ start:1084 stop:1266 length:183 start_codon:yes stop_codon:yes gene_type:complete